MKQTITIQNKEYTVEPYGKFHFRCFHNGNTTVGTIEEIKEVIIQGLNNILIQKLTIALKMMLDATVVQLSEEGKIWCDENDFDRDAKYSINSINSNGSFDLFDEVRDFATITQIPQEYILL